VRTPFHLIIDQHHSPIPEYHPPVFGVQIAVPCNACHCLEAETSGERPCGMCCLPKDVPRISPIGAVELPHCSASITTHSYRRIGTRPPRIRRTSSKLRSDQVRASCPWRSSCEETKHVSRPRALTGIGREASFVPHQRHYRWCCMKPLHSPPPTRRAGQWLSHHAVAFFKYYVKIP
jgi:hypothetical protein